MARFRIHCSTIKSYWLDVEAPNEEAVHEYYGNCDTENFNCEGEDNWEMNDIDELTWGAGVDITVNSDGEEIDASLAENPRGPGETEVIDPAREALIKSLKEDPRDREGLEGEYGKVWDTTEFQGDFIIYSFVAPHVIVKNKDTGEAGTLTFQHSPRFYFNWSPKLPE